MPINMSVFDGDAFTQASMIRGIQKRTYIPKGLDDIIGFEPVPVTTDVVYIGQKTRTNGVIQSTLRGAPIEMRSKPEKNYRPIQIPRIAEGDQLFAHQLANMAPWEDETDEDVVAAEIARMQEDLIGDVEMTEEHMRLGALNGLVLDKDGSTMVDYYDEFDLVAPSDIDLTLDNASMTIGELQEKIGTQLVIPISQAIGSGNAQQIQIRAVCGNAFWFKLTGHLAVTQTYQNYAAAANLRDGKVWETFDFGGVLWFHYRGTDDGSTIAINTNKAKVFPYRLPGMFQHVMGPANEFLDLIGQRGRRYVPFLVRDLQRNQWVQPEIYAYPLFVNARPDLVLTATV